MTDKELLELAAKASAEWAADAIKNIAKAEEPKP